MGHSRQAYRDNFQYLITFFFRKIIVKLHGGNQKIMVYHSQSGIISEKMIRADDESIKQ